MAKSSIVAYTYAADTWCPSCVHQAFTAEAKAAGRASEFRGFNTEAVLDWSADQLGIDRYNELTFDSGDFPKVVFSTQVEGVEYCGGCHNEIE